MNFIPSFSILASFVVAVVALTLTPGPDMALYLGKTLSQSRSAGFAAFVGASVGRLVHALLATIGVSTLLAASTTAFTSLKLVGGLYLLWLAFQTLHQRSIFKAVEASRCAPLQLGRVFLSGLGINLLNPKIVLFFLTFLPQFVTVSDPNASEKLVFLGLLVIVISAPFEIATILGAHRIAVMLKNSPTVLRIMDYIFALVLSGFAIKLIMANAN